MSVISSPNSSQSAPPSDVPSCWLTPDDVPDLETIAKTLHDDPVYADSFFFQETNDPANAEDGLYQGLVDYQAAIFETLDDNRVIWWQGSRGSAKSSTFARWAVGRCLRRPRTKIGIMAPSFRQSKQLFDYCVQYINDNAGIESHVYKVENEVLGEIKRGHEVIVNFKNGSLIEALPMGQTGEKLRGRRYNILALDEAYQLQKQMHDCVDADDRIMLSDGSEVRAGDLVGKSFEFPVLKNGDVCSGFVRSSGAVLSWKTASNDRFCTHPVFEDGPASIVSGTGFAADNGEQECYRIVAESGVELSRTWNHPLLTKKGWTKVHRIKSGDQIAVTSHLPIEGSKPLPKWHAELIGYMLGDGHCGPPQFSFCQMPGAQLDEFEEAARSLGCQVTRRGKPENRAVNAIVTNGEDARHQASRFRAFLDTYGMVGSRDYTKRVPKAVFEAPNEQVAKVLSRYIACDGCPSLGKNERAVQANVVSVSRELLGDVKRLLLRFGIHSRITRQQSYDKKYEKARVSFRLTVTKPASLIRLIDRVGYIGKADRWLELRRRAQVMLECDKAKADAHEQFCWVRVADIESIGLRPTVSISVPKDHAYATEVIEHNSHIMPMGNVKLGNESTKVVYMTTSWYTDCFAYTRLQDIARAIAKGHSGYAVIDVRLEDVINSGFPYDLDHVMHMIETQRDPITGALSDDLMMTFWNKWLKSSSNFYMPSWFADCQRSDIEVRAKRLDGDKTPAVCGVDLATSGSDKCAFAIGGLPGDNVRDLWALYQYTKLTPEEIAGYVHKACDRYDIDLFYMDKTGALGEDVVRLCGKEDQLIDGQWVKRTPIYKWDHPDARSGRSQIVLSLPSDERVQAGITGQRRVGSNLRGEIELKNYMHINMKGVLETGKFRTPRCITRPEDYESERGDLIDNMLEAFSQFPKVDRVKNPDGTLRVDTRGNWYWTKPVKDDAAYSVVYMNYAANIWNALNNDTKREASAVWEPRPDEAQMRKQNHPVVKPRLF